MADAPIWVVDTNVLVSGLLSPSGPHGRLIDVLLARRLSLALDDRIEHRVVLTAPVAATGDLRVRDRQQRDPQPVRQPHRRFLAAESRSLIAVS